VSSPRDWSVRRRTDSAVVPRLEPGGATQGGHPSHRLLELGRRCDRSGRIDEAIAAYEAAIDAAQPAGQYASPLAEALRRLAVLLQRRGQSDRAREAGLRSLEVATGANDMALRAEAFNTLGGLDLMQEDLTQAGEHLDRALELSRSLPELCGRVEQNLGILASMRGDRDTAMGHYQRSLKAFQAAANEQGCAVAYHNLGMVSADDHRWEDADRYFELGRRTAQAVGDDHLRGLCLMNRVEVLIALQRFDGAKLAAETALSIFEELHAPAAIAGVQRMLGIVFRETNQLSLAQSHLEAAVELAAEPGLAVSQGEALCEAARLHGRLGHLDQAIECLLRAARRFSEVPEVVRGPEIFSGKYPNLVRAWCGLLATVDPFLAQHSDRVARIVGAMAATLELPREQRVTACLAAKLHEIGRLRVADEATCSRAASTAGLLGGGSCFAEVAVVVGTLELPTSTIPLPCQIVSVADRFDRLMVSSDGGLTREQALDVLASERAGWHAGVYEALELATAS